MDRPKRYKVTFELLDSNETVSYEICTWHGELKAIVIATERHNYKNKGHILSVDINHLSGNEPAGTDLVDRMEW